MGLIPKPNITVTLLALTCVAVTWGLLPQQEHLRTTQDDQTTPKNSAKVESDKPLTLVNNGKTQSRQSRQSRLSNKLPDDFDKHFAQTDSWTKANPATLNVKQSRNHKQSLTSVSDKQVAEQYDPSNLGTDNTGLKIRNPGDTKISNGNPQKQVDFLYNLTPATDPTIVNSTLLENLLNDWASYNPAGAWHWINNNDATGTLNKYRVSVMQEWLTVDSNEAFLAINSLPSSNIRTRLIADYAAMAASYNPYQAFDWAASLTNPLERKKALDSVVYEWASNDPVEVIAQLDTAVSPQIKNQLLYSAGPTIASQLSQLDSRKAMLWTDTLNQEQQALLKPIAFQQWINQDSQEALSWLTNENKLADSSLYLSTSAAALPYRDLDSALTIYPHLQENIQQEMASSIAYSLYKEDPAQAQAWMYEISSPNILDKANTGYLMATATNEPFSALNMALEMDNNNNTDILATIAAEVDQQHPAALENWIANTSLSDTQLTTIRSALVRNPSDF